MGLGPDGLTRAERRRGDPPRPERLVAKNASTGAAPESAPKKKRGGNWPEYTLWTGIILQLVAIIVFLILWRGSSAKLGSATLIGFGISALGYAGIVAAPTIVRSWIGGLHAFGTLTLLGCVFGGFVVLMLSGVWVLGVIAVMLLFLIGLAALSQVVDK